jgi:hypothetical protein
MSSEEVEAAPSTFLCPALHVAPIIKERDLVRCPHCYMLDNLGSSNLYVELMDVDAKDNCTRLHEQDEVMCRNCVRTSHGWEILRHTPSACLAEGRGKEKPESTEAQRFAVRQDVAMTKANWHEEDGPVLWWKFTVVEPPYVGTPLDDDFPKGVTHFTPFVVPIMAAPIERSLVLVPVEADRE